MNSFDAEKFESDLLSLIRKYSGTTPENKKEIFEQITNLLKKSKDYGKPRPCCSCGKLLECIESLANWGSYQPYDGCEITITGAYGSSSHDMLTYKGIICDECVSNLNLESESCF